VALADLVKKFITPQQRSADATVHSGRGPHSAPKRETAVLPDPT
jgi:hypothetical protein